MPAIQGGYGRMQQPSCWDRVKQGFMMGCCIGMVTGGLAGGYRALSFGLRGRELLSALTKTMMQGGGTFGTFMAVGTAIRC